MVKITQGKRETQKSLQGKQLNVSVFLKMAIKLSVILGLTELIGYIQIPHPNEDEETFNVAIGFVYTVTRSLRGLLLWFVYINGRTLAKRYRKRVTRSSRKKSKITGSDNTASQMSETNLTEMPSSPIPKFFSEL